MSSLRTGYGNLFIIHKEFNMHFELDKYKDTLDQRFVSENLTPVNDGEQIKIFHTSVWVEALLKNPYSGDVYWGFIRHATFSDSHAGGVNAKINKYINSEIEKYPNVKQRAHTCKWLETTSTIIFNENAEPSNDMKI